MWTLIRREWNDNAPILVIGIAALIGLGVAILITGISAFDQGKIEWIGLPERFGGAFNISISLLSLLVAAFGANQLYKDRTKKISAFLVTLATTRQQVFLAKVFAGVIVVFLGILISAMPTIIFMKVRPPLLPVDYSFLNRGVVMGFCFVLTAYMLGLAVGFSKSLTGLVLLPMLLLTLFILMVFIQFSSVTTALMVLILMTLAFLIYARQQFLRASL